MAILSVSMQESISFPVGSALQLLLVNVFAPLPLSTAVAARDVRPIHRTGAAARLSIMQTSSCSRGSRSFTQHMQQKHRGCERIISIRPDNTLRLPHPSAFYHWIIRVAGMLGAFPDVSGQRRDSSPDKSPGPRRAS